MAPLTPISERSSILPSGRSSEDSWTRDHWADDDRDYSPVPSLKLPASVNGLSRPVSSSSYWSYHSSSDLSFSRTLSIYTPPISVQTSIDHVRDRSLSSSSSAGSIIRLGSDEMHVLMSLHGIQPYTHPGCVGGEQDRDYVEDSTSATRLSSGPLSAGLDGPVSALIDAASASQIPPTRLDSFQDFADKDTGEFGSIRARSRGPPNQYRPSSAEESSDRSRCTFFRRQTNCRSPIETCDHEPTGTITSHNTHSQESRSVFRKSTLLSIFRRHKTARNKSWAGGSSGRDETENRWGASRSRLSFWKSPHSRSLKSSAITTRLSRFRKHIESGWNRKRHPTREDQTTESSLEFIPDFDDRP